MKTNIYSILALGALALSAVSCDESWNYQTEEKGDLNLEALGIVSDDAVKMVSSTTATSKAEADDVDFSDYIITVTDAKDGSVVKEYTFGEGSEVLTLPSGDYTVQVESHKVADAEWEHPYYSGSESFTVSTGKITRVGTITAKFANVRVSVVFDGDLKAVMGDDAKVTISANDKGTLDFGKDETRSGYFKYLPGSTTLVAHFEGTIGGQKTICDTPFTDVEAGQHRVITYRLKNGPQIPDQTGTVVPDGIALDVDVTEEAIDANVNVEEDPIQGQNPPRPVEDPDEENPGPGPDDPIVDPQPEAAATFAPSAESTKLTLEGVNHVSASEDFGPAVVVITCPKGIQNLMVTISSDNETFIGLLAGMAFDKPFDLAHPSDEVLPNVETIGLPYGDQVLNRTTADFNITDFVPLLAGIEGNHTFVLEVTDNEGGKSSLTLKISVEPTE